MSDLTHPRGRQARNDTANLVTRRGTRVSSPPFARRPRVLFEALEPRILLAGDLPLGPPAGETAGALILTEDPQLQLAAATPTISWVGAVNGFWDVASNWRDTSGVARLPTATDDVAIDAAAANPTVTIRTGSGVPPAQARSLDIREALVLSGGTLNVTGELEVGAGGSFRLSGGTLTRATIVAGTTLTTSGGTIDQLHLAGTIELLSFSALAVTGGLHIDSGGLLRIGTAAAYSGIQVNINGDQTIDGPGEIQLPGTRFFGSSDRIVTNGNITFGPDLTVRGAAANITINAGSLTNQGTIVAIGGDLQLGSTGRTFTNAAGGVLRADGGQLVLNGNWSNAGQMVVTVAANSALYLGGSFTTAGLGSYTREGGTIYLSGVLDNTGATLTLDAVTGSWNLLGGTIKGGTLRLTGGAQLVDTTSGGLVSGVTLDGELTAVRLTVADGLTMLSGSVLKIGGAAPGFTFLHALVNFTGDQTIGGTGEIRFVGSRSGASNRLVIGGNVVLDTGITLDGQAGDVNVNGSLTNKGTIGPSAGGDIVVGSSGKSWTNAAGGVLRVDGAFLTLIGNWTNAGRIVVGSTLGTALNLGGAFTTARIGTITRDGTANNQIYLSGVLDNAGATFALDATTGSWNLLGGTIRGGTLATSGGAELLDTTSGGVLSGLTLTGTIMAVRLTVTDGLTLQDGALFRIGGTPTGRDFLHGDVTFSGNQTIDGPGTLRFVGARGFAVSSLRVGNNSNVILGRELRIEGDAANIAIPTGSRLVNQGTFDVTGGGGFVFGAGAGSFVNEGSMLFAGTGVRLATASVDLAAGSVFRNIGGATSLQGVLDNAGDTLVIDETLGLFSLDDGGTIRGGTVFATGVNDLQVLHGVGVLDGVTLRGTANISLAFSNFVAFRIRNGLALEDGLIRIGAGGTVSFEGTQTLGGTGSVVFEGTNTASRVVVPTAGTTLTVGPGITIRGSTGKVDATGAAFLNQGTIVADGGGTLTLIGAANAGGGVLAGGAWHAKGTGVLRFSGARVSTNAADVLVDGTGARILDDGSPEATLSGLLANLGTLTLRSGATLGVAGDFDNSGTVTIGSGAALVQDGPQFAASVLGFSSQFTATNWSAAQALGVPNTFAYGTSSTSWAPLAQNGGIESITVGYATPVYASGLTVRENRGNGFVRQIDLVDTNDVLHTVWTGIDPSLPGTVVDFNATWATTPYLVKGAKVTLDTRHNLATWEEIDSIQLHGYAAPGSYRQSQGATVLDGGRIGLVAGVDLTGGTLAGTGMIAGDVRNAARIDPGSPAGVLDVLGNYVQTAGGTLGIGLGGTTAGTQSDRLVVGGAATLGGTLDVDLINGFGPAFGDRFEVIDFASAFGAFATVDGLRTGFRPILAVDQGATHLALNGIANASDLAFEAMTIPATGAPGENLAVSFTVKNRQSTPAVGEWIDSVYLSLSPVLDDSAVLLGRVTHTGEVAGGASYTGSLSAPVPNLRAGNYHVIVLVESRGLIPDLVRANNAGVSSGVVTVSVPMLAIGTPVSGTIAAGQDIYFRLLVPPGRDIDIAATFATAGQAEFYVRHGDLPDRSTFDQTVEDLGDTQPKLKILNAQGGDYYILVHGRDGAGSGRSFTLVADAPAFEITRITPDQGDNTGDVTVTLTGSRFTADTRVVLANVLGTVYTEADVLFVDSQRVAATFHLERDLVPEGFFNVRAIDHGQTVTAAALFEVGGGSTNAVSVSIIAPGAVRVGQPIPVTIRIVNAGGADGTAPIIEVRASNVAENEKKKQFFGGGGETLPGILPPGYDGEIGVIYDPVPKASGTTSSFDLIIANPSTTLMDWESKKEEYRPSYVTPAAWDAVWANFRPRVGNTLADFYAVLRDDARALAQFGDFTIDIHDLLRFELEKAANDMPALPVLGETDLALPGQGMPLVYDRAFGSSLFDRFRQGRLGIGWSDTYDVQATTDAEGLVTIRQGGRVRFFGKLADGTYQAFPGEDASLSALSGALHLRETDGSSIVFRADGRLDYIGDTHDNRITAAYSGSRLTGVTHSDGTALEFEYNSAGFVSQVRDSAGRVVTYLYDAAGHLVTVGSGRGVTTYTYATQTSGPRAHAITAKTDPAGHHLFLSYDAQGRLASQSRDDGAESVAYIYGVNGFSMTDSMGRTGSVFFDHLGRPIVGIDSAGRQVQSAYDEANNLVAMGQAGGGIATFAYDARGNPVAAVNRAGESVSLQYEGALDRVTSWTDPRGVKTVFINDAEGNLLRTIYPDGTREEFVYDAHGNVVQATSRAGQVLSYAYDDRGLLIHKRYADGTHYDYAYDARGRLISATDAGGTTSFAYDAADRLVRVGYPGGRFLEFEYDAAGRRTRMADQDGFAVGYRYDALGRLSSLTDAAGRLLVRYTQDAAGHLVREDRGNGTYSTYQYDAAGALSRVAHCAPDGSVQSSLEYTYDSLGRRTSVTTLEGRTSYRYDAGGQLVVVERYDARVISYTYDAAGNRIGVSDGGVVTPYAANELNQYVSIGDQAYYYDANAALTGSGGYAYTYDADGRLIGVSGMGNSWSYQYDALGNRVASSHNGQTTSYLIDPTGLGNLVAEYDSGGQLIANYAHGLGPVSRVDAAGGEAYYAYDAIGNTTQLTGADGTILNAYEYLPFGESVRATETVANPFAFAGRAGVVRDATGLDFMRTRFYSPGLGRFLQVDPIGVMGGANLYEYARNNPVSLGDPGGLQPNPLLPFMPTFSPLAPTMSPAGATLVSEAETANALHGLLQSTNEGFVSGAERLVAEFGEATAVNGAEVAGSEAAELGAKTAVDMAVKRVSSRGAASMEANGFLLGFAALFAEAFVIGWAGYSVYEAERMGHLPPCPSDGNTLLDFITACDSAPISFGDPTATVKTVQVGPHDPNEIYGPGGFGPERFMQPEGLLPYIVYFENDARALAPAQNVVVREQLDSDLAWTTFELGDIKFGDTVVDVPEGRQVYETRVDLTATTGLLVDVSAGLDPVTGVVTWTFASLDPATMDTPMDPFAGFLPPNEADHRGEGSGTYFIRPKAGLATGTTLTAIATVVFDTEASIDTPLWSNTMDALGPTSSVTSLPAVTTDPQFTVNWSGLDDAGGSGIAAYDVFVSVDGGAYAALLTATTATSTTYTGSVGHTYAFYSVATDNVGHREAAPAGADATTRVESANTAPVAAPDEATTNIAMAVVVDVLGNDADAGGALDAATVTVTSAPLHGTTGIDPANGRITYTPAAGFFGVDRLRYTVADDEGAASNEAEVTITVAPSVARTLSVADFMRGPGQVVDVPATGSGLPIRLSDGAGVSEAAFDLQFDPALLQVASVRAGALLPAGTALTVTAMGAGALHVVVASPLPLAAGPVDLVVLEAGVPDTATYGATGIVDLSGASLNALAGTVVADDALQLVGYAGDADGDGSYTAADVTALQRVVVRFDKAFAAYPGIDPVLVGDLTGNGLLSSLDVSRLVQEINGVDRPEIPAVPLELGSLKVAAMTTGGGSVHLRFNHMIDPASLNLISATGGLAGPADMVVTGAVSGLARGSLALDADGKGFVFVKTGGVFAPDTYSVRLASGATGVQGGSGWLDGNGDGVAGDDAIRTFTVSASSAATVGIAEFARGPGQAVNLPADASTGIPVTLTNAAPVQRVAFTLVYDPALLTITAASLVPGLPAGTTLIQTATGAGRISLIVSTPTPIPAGTRTLVTLTAVVPETAPYGAAQVLDVLNVVVNATQLGRDDDGLQVVGFIGDGNGDGGYTEADVAAVQRVVVRLDGGFAAWPLVDPVVLADVSGNGALSSLDASRIRREVNFLGGIADTDRAEIPPIPESFVAGSAQGARVVSASADVAQIAFDAPPAPQSGVLQWTGLNADKGRDDWKRTFVRDALGSTRSPNTALRVTVPVVPAAVARL